MSQLSDFKRLFVEGAVLEVTNHYIKREDHAAYGTTRRRVVQVNGSAAYLAYLDDEGDVLKPYAAAQRFPFPKATQINETIGPDGHLWHTYGGGATQKPGELFLTIRVVKEATS